VEMNHPMKKETINATEYRKEVLVPNLSVFGFIPLFLVCILIHEGGNPIAIALFFFIGFLVLGGIFFGMWMHYTDGDKKKLLFRITVSDDAICSYARKKLICRVDKSVPIYYLIFKSNEATNSVVNYIAISNKPFMYNVIASRKKTLLSTYDETCQIVMQYNQKTKHLFDLADWEQVQSEAKEKPRCGSSAEIQGEGATFRCHALTYGQHLGLCIACIALAILCFQFSSDVLILVFPFMGIINLLLFYIAYHYTVTINDVGICCRRYETVEWAYSWEQIVKLKILEAPTHTTKSAIQVTPKSVQIIPNYFVGKGEACYFELSREAEVAIEQYKPEHIELSR